MTEEKPKRKAWNDRPYCVRHYRGFPRNPFKQHQWTKTSSGNDEQGWYENFSCKYCGLRMQSR